MGRIVVSQNITLDGVVEDPTGDTDFKHGGWFAAMNDADLAEWARVGHEQAEAAAAMLMGRLTDEYMGTRWNTRTGPWAERLNSMPKYVVSSTLDTAMWVNTTVLRGDAVDAVARLKQQIDGDIVVIASRQLTHALWEAGLVDEVRLILYPFVLGSGARLFPETVDMTTLRLTRNRPVGEALVELTYDIV